MNEPRASSESERERVPPLERTQGSAKVNLFGDTSEVARGLFPPTTTSLSFPPTKDLQKLTILVLQFE